MRVPSQGMAVAAPLLAHLLAIFATAVAGVHVAAVPYGTAPSASAVVNVGYQSDLSTAQRLKQQVKLGSTLAGVARGATCGCSWS